MTSTPTFTDHPSRRQFLAWGGAGLAGASLLGAAGCGGSSSSQQLKFTYWGSTYEKKAVSKAVERFEKKHADEAEIDAQHIPNAQYDTKVNALIAANNLPDCAYMSAPTGFRLAGQGKLLNMLSQVKKHPKIDDFMPDVWFYWEQDKAFTSWALEMILLLYNKDAFDKAGVDLPPWKAAEAWTWDEFVKVAQKLTLDQEGNRASDPGFDPKRIKQYGVYMYDMTASNIWQPLLYSNGAELVDKTGTKFAMDSSEAVEVFQNLQDLIYKYHVAPSPSDLGDNPPTTALQFQSGRAAMAIDGFWQLLDLNQSDLNYGVGVLPRYQEAVTTSVNSALVIPSKTEHQSEALELLIYLSEAENVDLYSAGLWMPGQQKYYTDPNLIEKWRQKKLPREQFDGAVVDYMVHNSKRDYHKYLKNQSAIENALTAGLDALALNKSPAKAVLADLKEKVEPKLKGAYPIAE